MTAFCGKKFTTLLRVALVVISFSYPTFFAISQEDLEKVAPQNPNYLQDIFVLPEAKALVSEKPLSQNLAKEDEPKITPLPEEKKPEITIKLPAWPQLLLVIGIISLFVLYRYRQKKLNKFRN